MTPEDRVRAALAAYAVRVQPRPALSLIQDRCKTAAPSGVGAAAEPDGWKEPKDMTIVTRHAREVRAGDIITRDPDHDGMPVRWRVSACPKLTGDGVALIDFVDISDEPVKGIAHFDALTDLHVEPAGGAS